MTETFAPVLRALAGTPRRIFLTAFAVFFALSTAFAVASPLDSAPDDQVQMVKAAATARGEFNAPLGHAEYTLPQGGVATEPVRYYQVPEAYANLNACFAYKINVSAACAPPLQGGDKLVSVASTAGQYNPIYYFIVGWPSLIFTGGDGMYLMRVMSALLCSLFLAGAVVTAAQWRRRAFAVVGVVATATPMVLFLNGMVNPNGLEASSAVLSWTVALSITLDPRPELLKRRLIWLALALAALANARPLGVDWAAGIVVVALFVMKRGVLAELLRNRVAWLVTGLTGLAVLFGAGWSMTHGDSSTVPYSPANAFAPAAHATFSLTNWYIQGMIGYFGWLDTPSPQVTYTIWTSAIILLVVLAWACSRLREGFAVLAMLVGVILIPVLAQGDEAKNLGLIWQGRYLLAFAVGLPILAGLAVAKNGVSIPAPIQRRLATILGVLLAFASFAAFYRCLHRYGAGLNSTWLPTHISWEPPGTWFLWLPVYAVALAGLVLLMAALGEGRAPDEEPAQLAEVAPEPGEEQELPEEFVPARSV